MPPTSILPKQDAELDLTVVIICYNSAQLIVDNLSEVLHSRRWRSLVVDNNSAGDTITLLRQHFPADKLVLLPRNEGYGRAANVVLGKLQTRYALLLNPDIIASEADITGFVEHARGQHPPAAIVAPATRPEEKTSTGMLECDEVLGAAMLFDQEQMRGIGWFDEQLFLYYEEKDLCRRARQAGSRILQDSDHYLRHDKGTSSGSSERIAYLKQWHVGWSSCYYLNKHGLDRGRRSPWFMLLRYSVKATLYYRDRGENLKYRARCAGVLAYIQGLAAFDADGQPRAS
ncbi:MAG: glycosyltransferase [Parahaliea sp.]